VNDAVYSDIDSMIGFDKDDDFNIDSVFANPDDGGSIF
jgi:hypothetical protein